MKKLMLISLIFVIILFLISIYFYPRMPEKIDSHWNAEGKADSQMGRFWGMFLIPVISLGLLLLFLVIPYIDPLKKNLEKFISYYYAFVLMMVLFFFYIHILTITWNLGYEFNLGVMLMPALAALFI